MRLILLLFIVLCARAVFAQESATPTDALAITQTPSATITLTPSRTSTALPTVPPTPQPTTEGFAAGGSGEVLFPEAIRFVANLSRPADELENVRLTIDTAAVEPVSLEFEPDEVAQGDDSEATLVYLWQVPEDAVPPLFSTVDFAWAVEAVDGETARIEGTVVFADQRVVWITTKEANDNFTVAAAREVPSSLVRGLLPIYELLTANTQRTENVRLLIYDEAVAPGCTLRGTGDDAETLAVGPFSGTSVECRPAFAERVYAASGYQVFQQQPSVDLETELVAAMVRAFYEPIWDEGDVPPWFASGLELLYAPALKSDLLAVAQTAGRSNRIFSLDGMSSPPPEDSERAAIWQAQSYGMLLWMVEQVGVEGLFDFANTVGGDESFASRYEAVFGESLDLLIPAWQRWIYTERAESVYGITPYQPATPTYTPTRTYTPTLTPSPTATLTPSVTPSVTGALSPTPYSTVTPSQTWTPEPPTVTPRPPLRTPTLVPGNPAISLSSPTMRVGVILVLLVLIVVLVIVYIRTGRR